MKRRTRFALAAMFDSLMPAELRNVDIASFYPTERFIQKLVIGIDPVQDGSGDPSPDNIRAISGWNETKIGISKTNWFDLPGFTDGYFIDATGNIGVNAVFAYSDYIPVDDNVSFVYDVENPYNQTYFLRVHSYDENYQWIEQITSIASPQDTRVFGEISIPSTAKYLRISYLEKENASIARAGFGNFYNIAWSGTAGTVYCGFLDVTTGELTITHKVIDLGDGTWLPSTQYNFMYSTFVSSEVVRPSSLSVEVPVLCSMAKSASAQAVDQAVSGAFVGVVPNGNIRLRYDGMSTDSAQFKSDVTGQQLLYPLATPLTYQLTPTQIATLRPGINNVWCDTGPVIELIS